MTDTGTQGDGFPPEADDPPNGEPVHEGAEGDAPPNGDDDGDGEAESEGGEAE